MHTLFIWAQFYPLVSETGGPYYGHCSWMALPKYVCLDTIQQPYIFECRQEFITTFYRRERKAPKEPQREIPNRQSVTMEHALSFFQEGQVKMSIKWIGGETSDLKE
jgi:hypothetical protein